VKDAFAVEDISLRAAGYGMPGIRVNGQDIRETHRVAGQAIARARSGGGPSFIVAETYRYEGHYYGDPQVYRTKDEIEDWRSKRDPLAIARTWIVAEKLATEADLDRIHREVDEEIERGVAFAEAGEPASPIRLPDDVYAS
jgi:TPP-dependent pyruvate/acetoin dehydrogenase alpha subunit